MEYVSTAKWRERRWRLFSTFPYKKQIGIGRKPKLPQFGVGVNDAGRCRMNDWETRTAQKHTSQWMLIFFLAVGFGVGLLPYMSLAGPSKNGFDLTKHTIPLDEIRQGGPPKDGIPAILTPTFIEAREATFLQAQDRILGFIQGDEAKAYPINILNWHEVVNDEVNGRPVVITYCPLCGTGIGFQRQVKGKTYTFGVSGLLYQSDMLMYDHQTESLWSQLEMTAVAGPLTGAVLSHVFLEHTTWEAWRQAHPTTKVLSTQTGYHRDYSRDPYLGYAGRMDLMFPVSHENDLHHPKEWVVGVEVEGVAKAYPFLELDRTSGQIRDRVSGSTIIIEFDSQARSAVVFDIQHRPIPSVMAYWFAWYAFHPDTLIFSYP